MTSAYDDAGVTAQNVSEKAPYVFQLLSVFCCAFGEQQTWKGSARIEGSCCADAEGSDEGLRRLAYRVPLIAKRANVIIPD